MDQLGDFRKLEDEKKLLSTWLKEVEKSENSFNNICNGQIIWITLHKRYFDFTFPVTVTNVIDVVDASVVEETKQDRLPAPINSKYIAPNLEKFASELRKRNQLPDIFCQHTDHLLSSKLPAQVMKKFNLVPLISLIDEESIEKRLPNVMKEYLESFDDVDYLTVDYYGRRIKYFYNTFKSLEDLVTLLSIPHQLVFSYKLGNRVGRQIK
jgi:hypothetical protein